LILKTDVLGSTEAIIESLEKINQEKVEVKIIKKGLGNITEKDVENAEALRAHLVGFNVKSTPETKKLAANCGVELRVFNVIYDLLNFIEEEVIKLVGVEKVMKKIGSLKVLKIFRTGKGWQIIGGDMTQGKVIADTWARVIHDRKVLGEVKIVEVESGKQKVSEVVEGQQAGLKIEGNVQVEEGDIIEIFIEQEK
jgi:translation initiation factor IF-2